MFINTIYRFYFLLIHVFPLIITQSLVTKTLNVKTDVYFDIKLSGNNAFVNQGTRYSKIFGFVYFNIL